MKKELREGHKEEMGGRTEGRIKEGRRKDERGKGRVKEVRGEKDL